MLKIRAVKHIVPLLCAMMLVCDVYANDTHIVIDPGHGGPDDAGMVSAGFSEKDTDLVLAKKIQAIIESKDKYEVVLTRIADYPVTLNDRRKIANQYEEAVYVSIHSSYYITEPKVVMYIQKQATTAKQTSILIPLEIVNSEKYARSLKLSKVLEGEFPEHVNHETIVSPYPLSNLVGIQPPGLMIECQCISQSAPEKDDGLLDEVARVISDGIQNFL